MKITSVETYVLEAPIERPVGRARQTVPVTARRCLLVKITTDEGLVGYGEGLTPLTPRPAAAVVSDIFRPLLLGKDPMNTEALWELLYSTNSSRGYIRGYQMIAISAVDIALWDLKGKILGQPVYNLLGGACRPSVPAYLTGLMLENDIELTVSLARDFYTKGFRAMKLKIGEDARKDMETIKALREALGPDLRLMIDANGGYDLKTALKVARMAEPYDIFWFEEPVTHEDWRAMAELRRQIPMYLAAGECEYTKYAFRDLLVNQAVDVCQPDVARSGGITETRRITALCQAFNAHYAPHAWGGAFCVAATYHLCMATPNLLMCEFDQVPNPLRDELTTEKPRLRDGGLYIPDKPGLGLDVDEEALRRFTVAS